MRIRWRWALYNVLAMTTVLVVFTVVLYVQIQRHIRQQVDAHLREEVKELVEELELADDPQGLKTTLEQRYATHGEYYFQIFAPDGSPFFISPHLEYVPLPAPPDPNAMRGPQWSELALSEEDGFRMLEFPARDADSRVWLFRALVSSRFVQREMAFYRWMIAGVAGGMVVFAAAVGVALATPMLAPLRSMTRTARRIVYEQLGERLPVGAARDEMSELAKMINMSMDRLAGALENIRRFTGDAAHELRSPLAALRAEIEVALRRPRSREEYRGVLERALVEVERLCAVIDQLLLLSKYDAGVLQSRIEPVDAGASLGEAVRRLESRAREKGIRLEMEAPSGCRIPANPVLLELMFANLIDNAIKFSPPGAQVSVRAVECAGELQVEIRDAGVGMHAEALQHACDRFYRAPTARTHGEGFGLGLAISRAVAESFGGELRITSPGPGRGTTVRIRLPRSNGTEPC